MHRKNPNPFLNPCYAAPSCAEPPKDECCPLCTGAMDMTNLEAWGADPSSPDWMDRDFLREEALAGLADLKRMNARTSELEIVRVGGRCEDGSMLTATFSVDRQGNVWWSSEGERTCVMRVVPGMLPS